MMPIDSGLFGGLVNAYNNQCHKLNRLPCMRLWALGRPAVLCLAVVFLVAGCGKRSGGPPPRPPRPVTAADAVAKDVPLYLDEIGTCAAVESVIIRPQVSGRITEVHFEDGAEVKKGDLLFTIDPRPYQAVLDQARARLAQDKAKLEFDRAQFARAQELRKTKVVAAQELDSAKATVDASEAQVEGDQAAVSTAEINLEYCFIRSPINGRASKRQVDVGNVVNAVNGVGMDALLGIQRQDPLYVNFTVAENALSQVRKYLAERGLKAEVFVPSDPERHRVGTVDFLDNAVRPEAGTINLRATLDNADRMFWPGQFVNVRLLLDTIKNAVLVPNQAVQFGQKGPFVFVIKSDSTVDLRPVVPGQRQGDDVVLSEGLKSGEKVVVTGQLALAPGAKVAIVPSQAGTGTTMPERKG
jgi:multidrug efflux system membrane fusion protein